MDGQRNVARSCRRGDEFRRDARPNCLSPLANGRDGPNARVDRLVRVLGDRRSGARRLCAERSGVRFPARTLVGVDPGERRLSRPRLFRRKRRVARADRDPNALSRRQAVGRERVLFRIRDRVRRVRDRADSRFRFLDGRSRGQFPERRGAARGRTVGAHNVYRNANGNGKSRERDDRLLRAVRNGAARLRLRSARRLYRLLRLRNDSGGPDVGVADARRSRRPTYRRLGDGRTSRARLSPGAVSRGRAGRSVRARRGFERNCGDRGQRARRNRRDFGARSARAGAFRRFRRRFGNLSRHARVRRRKRRAYGNVRALGNRGKRNRLRGAYRRRDDSCGRKLRRRLRNAARRRAFRAA